MNSVQLIGRLTRDPDVQTVNGAAGETKIARFSVAVDRPRKQGQEQQADFISCVAFGKRAELLGQYFHKGSRIGLSGRIQTGSYTNRENQKVYTTDVIVEQVDFLDPRQEQAQPQAAPAQGAQAPATGQQYYSQQSFQPYMQGFQPYEEGLPFR